MVSINSLLTVSACLGAAQLTQVRAESLGNAPTMLRDNNGIAPVDKHSMIRGQMLPPQTYLATDENGNRVSVQGDKVLGEVDMLNAAISANESEEIRYFETQYKITFVKNVDDLNGQYGRGQLSKIPWPSTYWPTAQDGINARWDEYSPSAAEKYARATGMNVQKFMDDISANSGIDSRASWDNPTACSRNSQCRENANDKVSVCAIREGKRSGYCMQTWEGICHAWAPAALLEDEPRCPVKINDVVFQPMDIKGLMSTVYDDASPDSISTGVRFWGGDRNRRDRFGRYQDFSHRDMSPAIFHLLCTNLIGRLDQGFVIDADADEQVWNQPVYSYELNDVTNMSPNEAAQYFFNTRSYQPFNNRVSKVQYVRNTFQYVGEGYEDGALAVPGVIEKYLATKEYTYLLELDNNNNIIGGEWVGDSMYDHPDFLWMSINRPAEDFVSAAGIRYDFVRMLTFMANDQEC